MRKITLTIQILQLIGGHERLIGSDEEDCTCTETQVANFA